MSEGEWAAGRLLAENDHVGEVHTLGFDGLGIWGHFAKDTACRKDLFDSAIDDFGGGKSKITSVVLCR